MVHTQPSSHTKNWPPMVRHSSPKVDFRVVTGGRLGWKRFVTLCKSIRVSTFMILGPISNVVRCGTDEVLTTLSDLVEVQDANRREMRMMVQASDGTGTLSK